MAVVPRKRKSGTVYTVENEWHGKTVYELIGTNKREAEIRDREMKREIKAGTYRPKSTAKALSFRQYAEQWHTERTNSSKDDEWRWIRLHVLPKTWFADCPIREHQVADVVRLVREIQAQGRLSPKSVANVHGVLHLIYRDADFAGLVSRNPADIPSGILDRSEGEEREPYAPNEAAVLIRNVNIDWAVRVLTALCFLAGLRKGEACGLKCGDIDTQSRPLWALDVRKQYGGAKVKTRRPRVVPVHPELQKMLEDWLTTGFELYMRRKPTADDYLVPAVGPRARSGHWTESMLYKGFVKACAIVNVRARSLHSARHTFITLARRAHANKDMLEKITHNARGDIVDRYTHFDWEPLCEVVLRLNLDVHRGELPPQDTPRGFGGHRNALLAPKVAEVLETTNMAPYSIPDASTAIQQETSQLVIRSREISRDFELTKKDLRDSIAFRRRGLVVLSEVDAAGARGPLALLDGYAAALDRDPELMLDALRRAGDALGGAAVCDA